MAQVYATDVFDVAAESALKDAISEAALASAVKKMKTGLANPQLLATVKDVRTQFQSIIFRTSPH